MYHERSACERYHATKPNKVGVILFSGRLGSEESGPVQQGAERPCASATSPRRFSMYVVFSVSLERTRSEVTVIEFCLW